MRVDFVNFIKLMFIFHIEAIISHRIPIQCCCFFFSCFGCETVGNGIENVH